MAFANVYSGIKVSQIKPSNNHLVEEQKRRRTVNREVNIRVNFQARATVLLNWLLQNPITNATDITFVRRAVGDLVALAAAKEQARADSARLQWSGSAPSVRLCHAVIDVEANKEAFLLSFKYMNREDLDVRHDPDVARPDAWTLIASASLILGRPCILIRTGRSTAKWTSPLPPR